MSTLRPCRCEYHHNSYEIILQFPHHSKAMEFLADLENWLAYKESLNGSPSPASQPKEKKEDKRGRHTKLLHQKAREYQAAHPLVPYHECMRLCSQTI